MKQFLLALCLLSLSGITALASSGSKPQFMPLEEIKPGMKGYGLTVFQGSTPQKFDVEVLGLLDGVPNPKQCSVIAKLSGPEVERTGVFAGMSGSPVYIDGKLVGAVAFSYPFSKEAIGGITPIKFMVENFEKGQDAQPSARQAVSFNTLIGKADALDKPIADLLAHPGVAASTAVAGPGVGAGLVPIATPVSFSGIPQWIIDRYAGDLRKLGIQAVAGMGSGSSMSPIVNATADTLMPGSSVSVALARGDFAYDAAGTVTYRDGDRIYAFGHPFLGSGVTSWPMSEASVITVIPNVNNSFKLSQSGPLVGSINQDRSTGIFGALGERPEMIPIHIKVHTSRDNEQTYNFEVISDPVLTPVLAKMGILAAITATERSIGSQTIKLTGNISVKGQPNVVLDDTFSAPNGAVFFAVAAIERPLAMLMASGFDRLNIQGVNIDVTSTDARSNGTLSRLLVDKTDVHRGDTVEVQAFARNDNGSEFVERIPVTIPADAPLGPIAVLVGDGASISQAELRARGADFVPRDLGQLVRGINNIKKNNRLYVKLLRTGGGAIVNNEEMPTLPPSVLATLGSDRISGGYAPLNYATLSEDVLPPSRFVISGTLSITVNVVK